MFKFIKELFKFREELKDSIKQHEENRKRYLAMSNEELAQLQDEALFEAALIRTENEVDMYDDMIEGINSLIGAKKNFYITSYYEMEVNNGGLCQFFVNSSRYVAPELSMALDEIKALEHKKAFDTFVKKNNIDLNDLSSFDIEDVSEFEQQNERYPFEAFDDAFYDMKPIQDYLTEYIEKNIEQF